MYFRLPLIGLLKISILFNECYSQTAVCGTNPTSCPDTKYRSYDGSCNNLKNWAFGSTNSEYDRLLPANYGDGISSFPLSVSGKELPGARNLSLALFPDVPLEDPTFTLNAMQYGQIITHDMSFTFLDDLPTACCTDDFQFKPPFEEPKFCHSILLASDDPDYSIMNGKCLSHLRTTTNHRADCGDKSKPAQQLSSVNNFLDLSIIYGNTLEDSKKLREFQGGRLRVEVRDKQQWFTHSSNIPSECPGLPQNVLQVCYHCGDQRVNQNTQLTLLHLIYLREHNRIAAALEKLNRKWDDETLFQEARKINNAEHQYISYYEYLPVIMGLESLLKNKILYQTKGFVNDYDENVNPSIFNEHASGAFRHFHSMIAGRLDLVAENRTTYGSLRLNDWSNRPQILETANNFDGLLRGLNTQASLASDVYHDKEFTKFMFQNTRPVGLDIKAIDIQRSRDHGLASYNDMRLLCGLKKAKSFDDFTDVIDIQHVKKLVRLYESPDDVDLLVAGSLEQNLPGTLVGPTFHCILLKQFYKSRVGDRFWFEHSGVEGFTLKQLNEIRKSSMSRLMCDNGREIRSMQPRGFEKISCKNPVVPCKSLPFVNLSLWKSN